MPAPKPKGSVDQIRQMVQCGGTIYAAGSFRSIVQGGTKFLRTGVFSFSATAPYKITSWRPKINGMVNSITFNGSNCSHAYIGGAFTSVAGTAARNIAEISTSTGAVQPGFGHSTTGGGVETLLGARGHILVGGEFTSINGSTADPYFASVSPATGKDDGFVHLKISGHYHYCRKAGGAGLSAPPARTPTSTTSSSATAGRSTWWRATSPRSAGSPGSRSSC